jgi:putative ABC transport system permease protein
MGAKELTLTSFLFFVILFIPIFIISFGWKLKLGKKILISVARMVAQLMGVGFYLKYLFYLNNPIVNLLYIIIMIFVATITVSNSAKLIKLKDYLLLLFLGTGIPTIVVILFFNKFVVRYEDILAARYLIPIGGMILGNCMRANIIGITTLTELLHEKRDEYQQLIMYGATRFQSISDFFFISLKKAIEPTIASIATIGLVSLPGMMTGQILGGSLPMTAIKYQIAIMLAIFGNMFYSVVLNLIFVYRKSFDKMDRLKF